MDKFSIVNGILKCENFFDSSKVLAGFSTNFFGDPGFKNFKEREKILKRIFSSVQLDYKNAVFQNQMHTNNITIVTKNDVCSGKISKQEAIQDNDGMITNDKNVILTAWGADCTPVYFYDSKNDVIALVHSGRKGTKLNISGVAVKFMKKHFGSNPKDISALLGPGICGECYQINKEIAKEFEDEFIITKKDKIFLDIKAKIKKQLKDAGILNVADVNICTKCDNRFYSYRREGKTHGSGLAYMALV